MCINSLVYLDLNGGMGLMGAGSVYVIL